jgi:Reverse transcriptase (RNA-dependent DNA polymerase)
MLSSKSRQTALAQLKQGSALRSQKVESVVSGFSQIYGVDYMGTFVPVAKLATLRILPAIAVRENWEKH